MSRPPKRAPGWPNPKAGPIAAAQSGGGWQEIVDDVRTWPTFVTEGQRVKMLCEIVRITYPSFLARKQPVLWGQHPENASHLVLSLQILTHGRLSPSFKGSINQIQCDH